MTRNKIEGGGTKQNQKVYIYIDFAKKETRQVRPKAFPEPLNPSRCLVRNALDAANGVWIGANVLP